MTVMSPGTSGRKSCMACSPTPASRSSGSVPAPCSPRRRWSAPCASTGPGWSRWSPRSSACPAAARASRSAPGWSPAPYAASGSLAPGFGALLAVDAALGFRPRLQPLVRQRIAALDAAAGSAGVQAGERLAHSLLLGEQHLQARLLAVGVREVGATVRGVLVERRQLTGVAAAVVLQHGGRPLELAQELLEPSTSLVLVHPHLHATPLPGPGRG